MPRCKGHAHLATVLALVALLAVAGCGGDGDGGDGSADTDARETPAGAPDRGDFEIVLEEPASGDNEAVAQFLEEQEIGNVAGVLNGNFSLPTDIPIVFRDAQEEGDGPYYDPEQGAIFIPYEFAVETEALFAEGAESEEALTDAITGTMEFVIYHEVGHALIDTLELPVTGKEEDAVDGLAAAIVTLGVEDGADSALSAAEWFALLSEQRGGAQGLELAAFADEHSLEEQRFFGILCWVYGSDPEAYAYLVEDGHLPEERAVRCPDEYEQNVTSWVRLLEPNLKD